MRPGGPHHYCTANRGTSYTRPCGHLASRTPSSSRCRGSLVYEALIRGATPLCLAPNGDHPHIAQQTMKWNLCAPRCSTFAIKKGSGRDCHHAQPSHCCTYKCPCTALCLHAIASRLIVDFTLSGINNETIRLAPSKAICFGRALQRILLVQVGVGGARLVQAQEAHQD